MTKFKVWEAFEETRVCLRLQEIEAENEQEALELAEDCNEPPDRKGDEEYSQSGFYIREANKEEDGIEWAEAITALEVAIGDRGDSANLEAAIRDAISSLCEADYDDGEHPVVERVIKDLRDAVGECTADLDRDYEEFDRENV